MGCMTSDFLCARPIQQKLVQKLQGLDFVWEEMFSTIHPWELNYTLFVLGECNTKYASEEPGFEWILKFGEKYYGELVGLVDWLSQPHMARLLDWTYCNAYGLTILNDCLIRCIFILGGVADFRARFIVG
jgi:hypothetical protein